jgi:predicted peroxiredoxin
VANDDRNVTLRRNLEQAIHCLMEADSVLKNKEDPRCAADDVWQAQELLRLVIQSGIAKILQCTSSVGKGT